jgi:hypothetical protein
MHIWSTAVAIILLTAMWQPTAFGNFMLSLTREYGRAVFSECRLDVVVYAGTGSASLNCVSAGTDGKGRPIPPLTGRQELTRPDVQKLMELLQRSRLFSGDYAGADSTPADGVFETLKVTVGAQTAVIVTSGNPSFKTDASRAELLALMTSLERALLQRAKEGATRR